MTLIAWSQDSPATLSTHDTSTGTTIFTESHGVVSPGGPVSWSPTRGVAWLTDGTASGGFLSDTGIAREYAPDTTPGDLITPHVTLPNTGGHQWTDIAYHQSGDVFALYQRNGGAAHSEIDRYSAGALISTTTLPGTSRPLRFAIRGDVIYYWGATSGGPNSGILRCDLTGSALTDFISGSITSVQSIAVDRAGRVLLCDPTTPLVTLYDNTGTSTNTYTIGSTGAYRGARFDPDGTSIWIARGGTIYQVDIALGTTLDSFTASGVDSFAVYYQPPIRRRSGLGAFTGTPTGINAGLGIH